LMLDENVARGLVVNPQVVRRNLAEHHPFMATETILMHATARGGDRQELHERIRRHSLEAARRMKDEGAPADLLERIASDPAFGVSREELDTLVDPRRFVGRAPEQVRRFLDEWVAPVLARHQARSGRIAEARIHV
ncbi:MAG: adenylosuccinate lyase, partial [Gemmatimonadetes bacterium]|nr:adenylosuccinate lyase [Gemmatimonadota bacterium]